MREEDREVLLEALETFLDHQPRSLSWQDDMALGRLCVLAKEVWTKLKKGEEL